MNEPGDARHGGDLSSDEPSLLPAKSVAPGDRRLRIDILTLFPGMFRGPFDESILGRARQTGLIEIYLHNIRDWAEGRHKVTDDYPFGGGPGMVMKPQPIFDCLAAVRPLAPAPGRVVLLTPQGRLLTQAVVRELAALPRLILICGHYEGVDERVR